MATITIEIGQKNNKSLCPVSFLVRQGQTKKRIKSGIALATSEIGKGNRIKNVTKARMIEEKRMELQTRLDNLSLDLIGADVDAAYIVQRLMATKDSLEFFSFAEKWIGTAGVRGVKNYRTMLNTLERFLKRRQLYFEDITYELLKEFELHLKSKPRAQSLYLGAIRHLYREAMRMYNTDYEQVIKNDPFVRYRVPHQTMNKGVRALTLEQLMKIYNFQGHGRAQFARDCFILSFCLMGMNSVDMYNCSSIKHNIIRYKRTKTHARRSDEAYIEVVVQPCVQELVKRYRGEGRVFDFYKRYSDASQFNKHLNIGLKKVGDAVGIKGLTFYQARHTFATLSRNLMRFSKSDVDEALNHVGTMSIADVYIAKDFSIINDNNKKLLEKVFG